MSTLPNPIEMLLQRAEQTPHAAYLHQPVKDVWRSYSWSEVADQSRRMAAALIALDLPKGSRVAITGMNTAHWFMADFACGIAGLVGVGLYPKQADSTVRFIIEHSEAKAVFLGPMPDVDGFLKALPEGPIKIAMPYPGVPEDVCEHRWDALVQAHEPLETVVSRGDEELWSLIYTSGTTGNPKGVMVTAKNLKFTTQGMLRDMPARPDGEYLFSYLPLAHAFERGAVELASIYLGAEVSFLEELDKLPATLKRVRPTRFYAVPLVWSRFQAAILKQLPQKKLDKLLGIPVLSWLVKRKLRKGMGFDRCWLRVSGAAPLPMATLKWFRKLGLDICQGYGMTENSIYCSINLPGANRLGSVGKPFVDSKLKLADGNEILNRHDGVTPGYYKDKEKTAELFSADGWLKTGDVGRLDDDGYLYITGRVKEIFKTAKGKYVAPAPIEGAFGTNTDIEQLCFVGNGLTQPIMVVALNEDARKKPRADVEQALQTTMDEVNAKLEAHERVAKVVVVSEAWTIDNGMVTPTMKIKRNAVEERYGDLLQKEIKQRGAVAWED